MIRRRGRRSVPGVAPGVVAAALVAAAGGMAGSDPAPVVALNDPHLAVVARTAEEAARVAAVTAPPASFDAAQPFEAMAGGAATSRALPGRDAFSQPSATMPFARQMDFRLGNALFRRPWVSAPASTIASDGLGPLFNARACQNCHLKDGRGRPPDGADPGAGTFLRVSIPADAHPLQTAIPGWHATAPDPVYGPQLQDFAIPGHRAEYTLAADWTEEAVALAGGETAALRRPAWRADNLGYGPLAPGAMLSPRMAPPMIGLGLLEAIPAADIVALADPDDADGDGVSGRASIAWSAEHDRPMLGRFGWKAGAATVRVQSAAAFSGDMGLSTALAPEAWGACTAAQTACRAARHGDDAAHGGLEVSDAALDLVTFYSRNLAVPARRDVDAPAVLRGKAAFHAAGCAACHRPAFVTHRLADRPEQSFQLVWPYTDLLLHDMGAGLADRRPEGVATGRERRTPPLWGLGLARTVGAERYLHDGRARSVLEAILWHGGEAQGARDAVAAMDPIERAALLAFLASL